MPLYCYKCETRQAKYICLITENLYCKKCKKDNVIPYYDKCEKCNNIACYNIKGNKTPKYCYLHKETEMINHKNKKCIDEKCCVTASFDYPDITDYKYCYEHKKDGMINNRRKRKRENEN
jgi:hypothetical protein